MSRVNTIQCIYACIFVLSYLHKGNSELTEDVSRNSQTVLANEEEIIEEKEIFNKEIKEQKDLQIRCPKPNPPENGVIKGEHIEIGGEIYVKCRDGYRLEGPAGMTCVFSKHGAVWQPDVRRVCVEIVSYPQTADTELSGAEQGTEPRLLNQNKIISPPSFKPREQPKAAWTRRHQEENMKEKKNKKPKPESTVKLPSSCMHEPETGPCSALFKRYYFNPAAKECYKFIYGGCDGNSNNFETLTDCNLACLGHE